MLKKLWEYFLLTMGVTPKGVEPAPREDRWAAARRIKERQERERIEREERERAERSGGT